MAVPRRQLFRSVQTAILAPICDIGRGERSVSVFAVQLFTNGRFEKFVLRRHEAYGALGSESCLKAEIFAAVASGRFVRIADLDARRSEWPQRARSGRIVIALFAPAASPSALGMNILYRNAAEKADVGASCSKLDRGNDRVAGQS